MLTESTTGEVMPLYRRKACLPLICAILLTTKQTYALTDSWIGPDQGLWTDPLNWTDGTPNSSTIDAFIGTLTPTTVQLNDSQTVNNLTLSAPNTLSLLSTLTLAGP